MLLCGVHGMVSETRAKIVSLLIGAVVGATSVLSFVYLFPELIVRRYLAHSELLKMQPRFDVRYYEVAESNQLAREMRQRDTSRGHPLTTSSQVYPNFDFDDGVPFGPDDNHSTLEALFPELSSDFANSSCYFTFFYFKYYGTFEIREAFLSVAVMEAPSNKTGLDALLQYNIQSAQTPKTGDYRIALGSVSPDSSFYLPIAVTCGNRDDGGWLYKVWYEPTAFLYYDPVNGEREIQSIRDILPDATIDTAEAYVRG